MILLVVGKEILGKALALKKKFEGVFVFLQYARSGEEVGEDTRHLLAGEFGKSAEF